MEGDRERTALRHRGSKPHCAIKNLKWRPGWLGNKQEAGRDLLCCPLRRFGWGKPNAWENAFSRDLMNRACCGLLRHGARAPSTSCLWNTMMSNQKLVHIETECNKILQTYDSNSFIELSDRMYVSEIW
jgi:hypothetical protein